MFAKLRTEAQSFEKNTETEIFLTVTETLKERKPNSWKKHKAFYASN